MNTLRTLYHLMRADFFERARRYSFLITLGLTIYVAYVYLPPSDSGYLGFSLGEVRGVYNSAWIGSIIAVLCSTLLILPGFYLVKDAITRDLDTRVGEIIATTPISKWKYALGKTLSNFACLTIMVAVIAVAGIIMQLIRGEDLHIKLWHYLIPILLSTLPMMLVISALAVLFESIPFLRGGFGNIVYGVFWLFLLIATIAGSESMGRLRVTNDPMGMTPIVFSMLEAAREEYPEVQSGFAIGGITVQGPIKTFVWNGAQWTMKTILGRALWIVVAIGLAMFSALLFNRFDPSTERWGRKKTKQKMMEEEEVISTPVPVRSEVRLTPLTTNREKTHGSFVRIFLAELRLMLKGLRWWWYLIALGLMIAGLFTPTDISRQYLLPSAWIWPILLWSSLGVREKRHDTDQIIFSAPHPLSRQFPFAWLAGVAVTLVTGAGVGINLMMAGDLPHLMAWGIGALFIPTLAFALGVWSGTSKLFEVAYMLWWYIGPINKMEILDFMGVSANIRVNTVLMYGLFTILFFAIAILGRKRQIKR
ncbi:MAG: hypothetical protein HND47_16160 [Chloroflexi bacterium]|nr:hypothetical protein [Chloroflexota bacterium]